jgi:hypothetical protein
VQANYEDIMDNLRWSLLAYGLSEDIINASLDVMLLQLHEEHNLVIKKKNGGGNFYACW